MMDQERNKEEASDVSFLQNSRQEVPRKKLSNVSIT